MTAAGQQRFKLGKYEIIARPMPYATHMMRYTVFLGGTRIGSLASRPSESDCRFLERPPVVPPLKQFSLAYRAGRPKKNATPPAQPGERAPAATDEELPEGVLVPQTRFTDDR